MHYGTPRHSGRYPWGSGKNPYQHEAWFLARERLKAKGLTETEIAKVMNLSTTVYRARVAIAADEERRARYAQAQQLYSELGPKWTEIGRRMGLRESTVRSMLQSDRDTRSSIVKTADILKDALKEKKYIDVGPGTETMMGIAKTKLDTAVQMLMEEGYTVHHYRQAQAGMPGKYTTMSVLCPPGTTKKELLDNRTDIATIIDYRSSERGKNIYGIEPPAPVNSKRIAVRYKEDGGGDKDGVIEIRRGVEDLSLGSSNYAQVRINVDDSHYLKGMAVYNDGKDMPKGVDIIFNTSKGKDTPMMGPKDNTVLKPLKDDPANPFGSQVKVKDGEVVGQRHYIGEDGKDHLSPINIVNEEGDWRTWSRTLSSQFLSKQYPTLAKQQLNLQYEKAKNEFEQIDKLTVPEIRKKMMDTFADECDSAAVYLKAEALPGQASRVILPLTSIKENECFAPSFREGEEVILVRYPHAGTFEIPVLKVNNHSKEGSDVIGKDGRDAIGIHPNAAKQLSGADFDGDTVVVIPVRGQNLKTSKAIPDLINFADNFHETYKYHDGMKVMSEGYKQQQMGVVSNLISDMTVMGATQDEVIRAVKHSMVVIDAVKHRLDYSQSYKDNAIDELKQKYQNGGGASTIITRAKNDQVINQRKAGDYRIDPKTGKEKLFYSDPVTGEKIYRDTGEKKRRYTVDEEGNKNWYETDQLKTTKVPKMSVTSDAYDLVSKKNGGMPIENIYADYANKMKHLANEARKSSLDIEMTKVNPSAKEAYSKEVDSLKAKLNVAKMNKPLERKAQTLVGEIMKAKKADNPGMDSDTEKKEKSKALIYARNAVGADKTAASVKITDSEWKAILSGAVSSNVLREIFDNTDLDRLKQLATPKSEIGLSAAQIARIHAYANGKHTIAEIADALGISASTVEKYIKE
ncbi:MAG: helix-turn-helix domain-containing protein [Lachnospiraceae bacterium]|nr:helix-turn-helix domain-containing protein [Lachnospiraceae bacterium]